VNIRLRFFCAKKFEGEKFILSEARVEVSPGGTTPKASVVNIRLRFFCAKKFEGEKFILSEARVEVSLGETTPKASVVNIRLRFFCAKKLVGVTIQVLLSRNRISRLIAQT